MDIDMVGKGIGLFGSALTVLKQAISMLPDNSQKDDVVAYLEKAEREFKLAESQIATELGYEICRKHFPPVVMLSEDDLNWECPECHNTKKPDDWEALGV